MSSTVLAAAQPDDLISKLRERPIEWRLHWLLRVALFCEFVGHGAFGILGKPGWVPYFGVFGIPPALAVKLMPVVGAIDITLGIVSLVSPRRALLAYMAAWGLMTATLRPLSGESAWELIERSYNYGIPLAMLWLHGFGRTWEEWTAPLRTMPPLDSRHATALDGALRTIMALMLLGHGAYGALVGKPALLAHYAAIGADGWGMPLPALRSAIGVVEMAAGLLCLGVRTRWFFAIVFAWKFGSEFLHVPARAYGAWLEVLERGASYSAPLAWLIANRVKGRA